MSLNSSLSAYKAELASTAARNTRPTVPISRTTTPNTTTTKRPHDSAFAPPPPPPPPTITTTPNTSTTTTGPGSELMTQVLHTIAYLKSQPTRTFDWPSLISYLSLPRDLLRNLPLLKRALTNNERVQVLLLPASQPGIKGKEVFKYRPLHPVTNAEELREYLARRQTTTATGVSVKELKDGWPDCAPVLDTLERAGFLLVTRKRKDDSAVSVYPDNPSWHLDPPSATTPSKATPYPPVPKLDADLASFWLGIKLPASEDEMRMELEKAGITPTSTVKEVVVKGQGKRERKRVVRANARKTNSHMEGILKDYSKRGGKG